jgi:hypothetical protein
MGAVIAFGGCNAELINPAPARKAETMNAPQLGVSYDFRGARLGMTLAEARALSLPSGPSTDLMANDVTYGPVRLHCNTDTPAQFFMSDVEKALGIVECKFGRRVTSKHGGSSTFEPTAFSMGSGNTRDVRYMFLDGRLFAIWIVAKKIFFEIERDELTTKFGPPNDVLNDTIRIRDGVDDPHTLLTWINPAVKIILETPWGRVEDMHVRYITIEGRNRMFAKNRELHPDAD